MLRVFFNSNFISITKEEAEDWEVIKPQVFGTIMDYHTSGKPVLLDSSPITVRYPEFFFLIFGIFFEFF